MRIVYKWLSNCCGDEILAADKDGHGKCASCCENCVPYMGDAESEE